jgi:hypothetical protein
MALPSRRVKSEEDTLTLCAFSIRIAPIRDKPQSPPKEGGGGRRRRREEEEEEEEDKERGEDEIIGSTSVSL